MPNAPAETVAATKERARIVPKAHPVAAPHERAHRPGADEHAADEPANRVAHIRVE